MDADSRHETPSTTIPRTLRELSGAPSGTPLVEDRVLIIIDAQREYLDGALPLADIGSAIENVVELLGHARTHGVPVIHVAHVGKPGRPFDPDRGGRIIDAVSPTGDETLVPKGLPNAFTDTDLRAGIAATGRSQLILCGFMTHMCLSSTARAALDLGLSTTVVSDASATRDLPAAAGSGVVPADVVHRAALAALADRFALVLPTSALGD